MSNSTIAKSLFLKGESSFVGLAEIIEALHCARSQETLDSSARELISIARSARLAHDSVLCDQACAVILSLPVSPNLHSVAEYYQALSAQSHGSDVAKKRQTLVRAADRTDPAYKPRIMLEIGATYESPEDISEPLRYYLEAARAAGDQDMLARTNALSWIALLRSDDGDHRRALKELEALFPMVAAWGKVHPAIHAEYLNNLAVVLCRAGMIGRAERAVDAALASPFAHRFPEWHETKREIADAAAAEPHRISPTFRVTAASAPAAESGKDTRPRPVAERAPVALQLDSLLRPNTALARIGAGHRVITRSPNLLIRNAFFLFLIPPIRRDASITGIPASDRPSALILERYIKTARTRGPP